jgi:hypothetical protein
MMDSHKSARAETAIPDLTRRLACVEFNEAPRVCDGGSNSPRAEAREGRKGGSSFQFLIGNQVRIEFPVTYSKQRTDANSNR